MASRPLTGPGTRANPRPDGMGVMGNQVGISRMAPKPLGQPVLQSVQRLGPPGLSTGLPAAMIDVPLYRLTAAPEFLRDPPEAPAEGVEPQHRRNLVRCQH